MVLLFFPAVTRGAAILFRTAINISLDKVVNFPVLAEI
jgi:hypothetical protein